MATIHIPCLACPGSASVDEAAATANCAACGTALPPPAAVAWMVARDGAQFGPYTAAQLVAYVGEGRVLPGDLVWHPGAPAWVPVHQTAALAAPAPAPQAEPQSAPVAEVASESSVQPEQPRPEAPVAPAPAEPVVPDVQATAPAADAPAAAAPAPEQPPAAASEPAYAPQPEPAYAPAAQPAYAPQPQPSYAPQPSYPAPPGSNRIGLYFRRALGWDLRAMPVEPDEEARLLANGVDEANAQRYLVWRRSVLLVVAVPTLISAVLATISWATTDRSSLSGLGNFLEILRVLALYALPLTAWLAAAAWDRHRRSRAILVYGWLFAFLTPLILALIPFSWRIELNGDAATVTQAMSLIGLLGAIAVYVTLMPSVLSLIPGVIRACLRIKTLLPDSILPGLFLVAATPLYVLLFLVIFSTVNQVAGNGILMLAVLALLIAPLLYLLNAGTFSRPLKTQDEVAKVGSIQTLATIVMWIGLALIVVYAFTATIMGKALIGTEEATSVIRPWSPSLIQFPLEYFVRSLFTTVVVADLFMMMNLSLWRYSRDFQASPEAQQYDRMMSEIEEVGARPGRAS